MTAVWLLVGICIGGIGVLAIGCCVLAGQADRREEEDAYLESLKARLSDSSGGDPDVRPSSAGSPPRPAESPQENRHSSPLALPSAATRDAAHDSERPQPAA